MVGPRYQSASQLENRVPIPPSLLTAHVMKNAPWVLQEATVPRARLEGTAFCLFVVIDEVLESNIWKKWFDPLKLGELQHMKIPGHAPERGLPAEAELHAELTRVVDAIQASMAGLQRRFAVPAATAA